MTTLRNRVIGMFMGGAIGDALGAPVETLSSEAIKERYGRVQSYLTVGDDHKWLTSDIHNESKAYLPIGGITDDTQLTQATLMGIGDINNRKDINFNEIMSGIARYHVHFLDRSVGWGRSTREAVTHLRNGSDWRASGLLLNKYSGFGNGVAMKCSPLAILYLLKEYKDILPNYQPVVQYSAMTHATVIGAESGVIHTNTMAYLLRNPTDENISETIVDLASEIIWNHKEDLSNKWGWSTANMRQHPESLKTPLMKLNQIFKQGKIQTTSLEKVQNTFGRGRCNVYDSLPFSYFFFLRNPYSVNSILDVINAGGDTDSNGKIVGEMIGALNGFDIFLKKENLWMIQGLRSNEYLLKFIIDFCDKLGIK